MIRAAAIASPHASVETHRAGRARARAGRGAAAHGLLARCAAPTCTCTTGGCRGVPYPLVPGHVSVGRIEEMRGAVTTWRARLPRRRPRHVPRRPRDLRRLLPVPRREADDALSRAQGVRHHLRREGRAARRVGRADLDEAGREDDPAARGLAPETFIGGGCGLVTALHAIDLAEIRLVESVVVLGVGPVGQSIAALARLSGAGEVIVDRRAGRSPGVREADGRHTTIGSATQSRRHEGAKARRSSCAAIDEVRRSRADTAPTS